MRTESGGFRVKKWMTFKADTYYSIDVSKLSGILARVRSAKLQLSST